MSDQELADRRYPPFGTKHADPVAVQKSQRLFFAHRRVRQFQHRSRRLPLAHFLEPPERRCITDFD